MKKRWIVLIVVVVIVLLGGFLRGRAVMRGQRAEMFDPVVNPEMVVAVEKSELKKTVSATGYLNPSKEKLLTFTQVGKVTEILVEKGQEIKAGDLLVQIDKKQQEYNYAKALRAYESAKINGSAADIREQELNLKIAKDNLDATVLKAPFNGRVTEIFIEEGDYVNGGQGVVKVIDDTTYEIKVSVDESDSHLIKVGQAAEVTMDALPEATFAGEVESVSYQTENVNGIVNVPVTVVLKEVNESFRPGFSTELDIIVDSVAEQVVVPVTAVFNDKGQEKVMLVKSNKSESVVVKTGLSNGIKVAITEGLQPGDQVIKNAYEYSGVNAVQNRGFMMGPDRGNQNGPRGDR